MSFSLIKILEDLRTTHGKKAMYVHFSEEKTPVKRQRPSILTVQRMTRPREFCWKCQSLAYQLSHYMCQCATTSVRWPTFVECFETAPLQYESWCTLCFWLMVWLKITRRSQKCFVCLFDGPAYRRTCLAGTVVLPDTRAALCVFHQTASRFQPIPIEWKNCIYIRMNSQ